MSIPSSVPGSSPTPFPQIGRLNQGVTTQRIAQAGQTPATPTALPNNAPPPLDSQQNQLKMTTGVNKKTSFEANVFTMPNPSVSQTPQQPNQKPKMSKSELAASIQQIIQTLQSALPANPPSIFGEIVGKLGAIGHKLKEDLSASGEANPPADTPSAGEVTQPSDSPEPTPVDGPDTLDAPEDSEGPEGPDGPDGPDSPDDPESPDLDGPDGPNETEDTAPEVDGNDEGNEPENPEVQGSGEQGSGDSEGSSHVNTDEDQSPDITKNPVTSETKKDLGNVYKEIYSHLHGKRVEQELQKLNDSQRDLLQKLYEQMKSIIVAVGPR